MLKALPSVPLSAKTSGPSGTEVGDVGLKPRRPRVRNGGLSSSTGVTAVAAARTVMLPRPSLARCGEPKKHGWQTVDRLCTTMWIVGEQEENTCTCGRVAPLRGSSIDMRNGGWMPPCASLKTGDRMWIGRQEVRDRASASRLADVADPPGARLPHRAADLRRCASLGTFGGRLTSRVKRLHLRSLGRPANL